MVREARQTRDRHMFEETLSLGFGATKGSQGGPGPCQLRARSHPREDGSRRITIEIGSDLEASVVDLTAGEAAEFMFELGAALEQAARDEKRALQNLPRLPVILRERI